MFQLLEIPQADHGWTNATLSVRGLLPPGLSDLPHYLSAFLRGPENLGEIISRTYTFRRKSAPKAYGPSHIKTHIRGPPASLNSCTECPRSVQIAPVPGRREDFPLFMFQRTRRPRPPRLPRLSGVGISAAQNRRLGGGSICYS